MKLKKLIADLPIKVASGSKEVDVTGLCAHSKFVAPGDLFIAKTPHYIPEAVSSGAAAILTDFYDPFLKNEVVQLITDQVEEIQASIASRFFNQPISSLFAIGVTGTNGKTTTSYLIKHLLDQIESNRCGLIGTIEYIVGDFHFESELTTPDVITIHKLLSEMVKQKCSSVVMEASSHGLKQGRVNGIDFSAAIFTNLSQDHLDYHGSIEAYAEAKALLFQNLKPTGVAIVNKESYWSAKMLEQCRAKTLSYGLTEDADIYAHEINFYADHTDFMVTYKGESVPFSWSVIGRFNILNALAAITLCISKGIELKTLPPHFLTFPPIPGRLERVENNLGLHLYVDFAHTPDALENVLKSLREFITGKIIVLFGAGGDRDRDKRPKMGLVADTYSDFALITSDNPRSEDPTLICDQVASGFKSDHYFIETDRKKAIKQAIEMAQKEDAILFAGKGHEPYQVFSHQTLPFDDSQIVSETLNEVRCS